jgi:hypothetical protein
MTKKFLRHIIILSILIGQLTVFTHNFEFDSDHYDHHDDQSHECEVCFYTAKFNHIGGFDYHIIFTSENFLKNNYQNLVFESFDKFNAFSVRAPPFFC